ncbi:Putative uncharacterized protein [Candidatus Glomeribacter gigasporarum BEG34]|uniref:Uncharacterized protein n=1 Tax=Candidatus Glomeribacter gigasporarum BEG34 TaxID=1070319 RepID=G2JBE9_9BURK|nr:hypothetical protein [Candidatus Glomeribacter gigasporarum]CCD30103.1 Putative uncharacterized protein [Candidatus Glomeribacter gigasporarum BEG34]
MPTSPTNPPSHADEAWKDALDRYFPEFMQFFYADIAHKIDWQAGHEMLDKELLALTTESMVGKRLVDQLIKVRFKEGQDGFVLLHVEAVRRAKSHTGNEVISFQGILAPCSYVTGSQTLPRPRVSNKIGRMQGTKAGRGRAFPSSDCQGKRRRVNASELSSQFRNVRKSEIKADTLSPKGI